MPKPNPFPSCTPSRLVTARRFPEQWAWWRASGWQMMVEDAAGGGLHLHSLRERHGHTLWGAEASADEAATPGQVCHFLTTSLYFHLHPIKARRAFDATGEVCSEKELAAFIRAQRRKVATK